MGSTHTRETQKKREFGEGEGENLHLHCHTRPVAPSSGDVTHRNQQTPPRGEQPPLLLPCRTAAGPCLISPAISRPPKILQPWCSSELHCSSPSVVPAVQYSPCRQYSWQTPNENFRPTAANQRASLLQSDVPMVVQPLPARSPCTTTLNQPSDDQATERRLLYRDLRPA